MTENTQDKNQSTEERNQDTKKFVRQVRSATRRKSTAEEKIHIGFERLRREVTPNELCRREGIKPNNFHSWTEEFMESGKQRLSRDTTRDATRLEINALKRERVDLKYLVAELSLDFHRLKKTSIPSPDEGHISARASTRRPKPFRKLRPSQAPSARFCQSLKYPRATTTAGEPDTGKEALRTVDTQAHPGTA